MKPEVTLVLLGEDHTGRDEMNLAGNPFALLQAASKAGQSVIQYDFERTLTNGKIVRAAWEVTGHPILGLPGPSEELLYLVLLQLTREAANGDEWPRMVNFSRYDVIARMGWSDKGGVTKTLADCFTRLSNVTINAKNAFWNARAKAPYEAVSFHLLDDFGISPEPRGRKDQSALPLSWFRWNEVLHESFLAGNVRSLALDFVLSMEHPSTRRLFRLLELFRYSHKPPLQNFEIGLTKLRDRMGMTAYAYPSKIKEKLQPAVDELVARGYLQDVSFRKGIGGEVAAFSFGSLSISIEAPPLENPRPRKTTATALLVPEPESSIFPIEAHAVFKALSGADKERLRQMARKDVEPAFWDRLERPDSPMALVLWEIVIREFPEAYAVAVAG